MKKYTVILLMIVLSAAVVFCASCTNNRGNSNITETMREEQTDDGDPYTFNTVADLKAAIKKNPEQYENKQVSVEGSIVFNDNRVILSDAVGDGGVQFRLNALKSPNITIIMTSDKKATLLDDGDYVKIYGTVKISAVEIYLDNCDYEMIKSIYE